MSRPPNTPTALRDLLTEMLRANDLAGFKHHLSIGAPVDSLVSPHRTILQAAVDPRSPGTYDGKRQEIVALLLAHGADPNLRTRGASGGQETALLIACSGASWGAEVHRVIHMLLDAGANATLRNEKGEGALSRAVHMDPTLVSRLVEKGAPGDVLTGDAPTLMEALRRHDPATTALLLKAGAAVNRLESFCYDGDSGSPIGQAALHIAPTLEIVEALLAHGADPNVRDRLLRAPLHRLTGTVVGELQTGAMFEALVRAGADLEARDGLGRTPLLAWAEMKPSGNSQCCVTDAILTLLRLGANPDALNASGLGLEDLPQAKTNEVAAWRAAHAARAAAETTLKRGLAA